MSTPSTARDAAPLPREREAKFILAQPGQAAALQTLLAQQGVSFGSQTVVTHLDTYLDTPSFDLYRRGLSLRLRRVGDQQELGLKQVGSSSTASSTTASSTTAGIQDRIDFSTPLDSTHTLDHPRAWPKAMTQELLPLVAKLDALQPLVELHQTRHKQTVTLPEREKPIAEWSVDQVQIRLPSAEAGPALALLDELELELLDPAASAIFDEWAAALGAVQGVHPAPTSKFGRALHLVLQRRCHPQPERAPSSCYRTLPLAEACRGILCDQLAAILRHEASVRAGDDPEAVHAMRVAIRRSRAALHLFGHTFRPKVLRRHRRGLKALGRTLGQVRDLDVALANLETQRKQMPTAMRNQLRPLRKMLRTRRRAAYAKLIKRLDGDEHRAFISAFAAFCTTPGRGVIRLEDVAPEEVTPIQVRHTMPSIIWRCFEQVRAYETALTAADLPPLPTFHSLRIQAKYLRYSLEFAAGLLGEPGEGLIAQLTELQNHLGALNDAHVEQRRLQEWAAELENKEILAVRAAALEATLHELMTASPAKLAQVTSPHSRHRLGQALANI